MQLYSSYAIALYDMSIEDIQERAAKRIVFTKAIQGANFLGIPQDQLHKRIGINKYAYHRETGKKYAVRKISL